MTGTKCVLSALLVLCLAPGIAQAQQRHAILIGGLGGTPEQTDRLRQYLYDARQAFVGPLGFDEERVTVLAETALAEEDFVNEVSTSENIGGHFEELADDVTAEDLVFVLLFGHGTYDGRAARFNIPRRDLEASRYAGLLNRLRAERTVFINTASASGPFVGELSAPDRIVITATRTGTQHNQTVFPDFLVEALSDPAADLDKDGGLSVREAFQFAAERTAASFAASGHLATEHSLLEDTGDGTGYRLEELNDAGEGYLAQVTYFRSADDLELPAGAGPLASDKRELEQEIALLKSRKQDLAEERYWTELERLFVALARLNEQIESAVR